MARKKTYSSNELKATAGTFFDNNEGILKVYATSDGYFFKSENRATLHASRNGLSVFEYTKTGGEPDVDESTPEFLDENAATVIAGVKSLTLADAISYESAEASGKNRKTVLKALNDYIDKSPTDVSIAAVEGAVVDQEATLDITLTPDPAENDKVDDTLYFDSDDPEKVTVSSEGVVSFLAAGEVTVTATAQSGYVSGDVTFTISAE